MSAINPLPAGASAPSFDYVTADGTSVNTEDLRGQQYLVYFYPKDDTPGCTKEACAFRDNFPNFESLKLTIIGVSGDPLNSHEKFRAKYELPFPLASDTEDFSIARAFGVYGQKKFMGRIYDGIHRISFLVGVDGKIVKTYLKVKPDIHPTEVLEDAQ